MKTAPTDKEILDYARREARRAISVRRVDPAGADRIAAEAGAQCDAWYAERVAQRIGGGAVSGSRLALRTPCCDRAVRGVALMQIATVNVRRRCPCGIAWAVTIRPISIRPDASVHQADWARLENHTTTETP